MLNIYQKKPQAGFGRLGMSKVVLSAGLRLDFLRDIFGGMMYFLFEWYKKADEKDDKSIGVEKHSSSVCWLMMDLVAGEFGKVPSFVFIEDINEMFGKYNGILRS